MSQEARFVENWNFALSSVNWVLVEYLYLRGFGQTSAGLGCPMPS